MTGNVLTTGRWKVSDALAKQIDDAGLNLVPINPESAFDLPPCEPGCRVVGALSPEEFDLFAEVTAVYRRMGAIEREGAAASMEHASKRLREGMQDKPIDPEFLSEQEALKAEHARLRQAWRMLHANLHWKMGERLNAHSVRLGVRSGYRIVELGPRVD